METPENSTDNRIALWPGRNREKGSNEPYLTGKLTISDETCPHCKKKLQPRAWFVTLWKRNRNSASQPLLSGHVQLSDDDKLEI